MTITPNWLEKRAYLSPNKEAIVLPDGTTYTFQQLKDDARSYAAYLQQQGFKKGDHIAVLSSNSYEMAVIIHALHYIQAISFLLNVRLTENELEFQINDGEVQGLIYHPEFEETAQSLTKRTSIKACNLFDIPSDQTLDQGQEEINFDDISHTLYTSGTTGYPKGVQLTYGNHFWNATASAFNLGLHDHDRWLLSLPMFHVGGLSILYRSVIYGIPIHLHEKFELERVHEDIMKRGVTIVSVVTVMLEQLMRRLGQDRYPETLRCMLLGGGPAPKGLLETCQEANVPVFQSYGMTETASQFCTLDQENMLSKIGSAGKPLFPGQLKIVENGRDCPSQEVGEIVVKGPSVTEGYWKRPEANQAAFNDGWLKTGDLGYLDEDGFLFVVDRRKDLIISGGENVYPAEIEATIKRINGVLDAGVVGVADDRWGQVPVAFVVKSDGTLDETGVISFAQEHLAKYKIPKKVYFIDELPRNASKKLQRRKLLDLIDREGEK
ncbi:o-succinylbenzoate--CoA ligase [Tenuibacillus multivorans]|uniref:2-succinylbenzoate--CoA ligase n=1 Tax=Tenuibacillus multivorans TaxID=237069 RepID=A0A1H0FQR6_9BACI|nr:o-succinylbenzoate--CoA ligase [Tenuibacillus multivorans]GEL77922.1 2-succinylbenzoate--CoA ligase [Tenuibacillus multivorans]SDN97006.1 O-succinylbenzoic acid--CoA ligase [Tenuibacillus multivorans]